MNGCEDPSLSYECDLTAERDALAAELASIKAHSKFQADCARQTSLALIDAGVKSFGFNADGVKALAALLAEAEREDKRLTAEVFRMSIELAEAERDAARYREVWNSWPLTFGEMLQNVYGIYPIENKAQGDAAIDAAMERQP